jgi:alanyl-tRNA synthetase
MTERLYYTDAYLTEFDATVVSSEPREGGSFCVVLDRTAFYPTSGGQPFDTGMLGGARVTDVADREDGEIVHVTDTPLEPGASVSGVIDWPRRFEHMQQHTGQHVLSAAFDRLFSVRTESFHLGAETCTIDLAREVTPAETAAAVDEADRVVWEDRPVTVRFVTPEEAVTLPLRKEPARDGLLRVIDIEDFDLSACGGTHVARAGAIGVIVASGSEKVRGGSRVQFLCGVRARRCFDGWRDVMAGARRHLSVAPAELADAIERLQGENKALQRTTRDLQQKLAGFEAKALVSRGTWTGTRAVVAEALDGWDAPGLRALAMAAGAETGVAVALFDTGTPAVVAIGCHPESGVDAGAALKALVARFGGKGGGKPDLAQGGGLQGTSAELVAAATEILSG